MNPVTRSDAAEEVSRSKESLPISELLLRPGVMEVLLAAVTFLLYCGTLAFNFVYDDRLVILNNPAITKWSYVPHYFTGNVWSLIDKSVAANYYRPIFLVWCRIVDALFGLNPTSWHAMNVLLQILVTVQVYWLAKRLLKSEWTSALAAALFAVHPSHVESVAWVCGSTDPILAVFSLATVLCFLRYIEQRESEQSGSLDYAAAIIFAALALMSKEIAVMLPLMMVPTALAVRHHKTSARTIGIATLPFFAVVAVYFVVRRIALSGLSHPLTPFTWGSMLLTWPSVIAFYLRQLLLPFWISPFSNVQQIGVATIKEFWIPLAICIAAATAAWIIWKRSANRDVVTAAFAWIAFPVAPVLYLKVFSPAELVHDRYLYLSTIGLSLLFGLAVSWIWRNRPAMATAANIAAACLLVLFAALTVNGELYWASDLLLFKHGLELAPKNETAMVNLGIMYAEHDRADLAEPLLKEVADQHPNSISPAFNYAHFLAVNNRWAEAERYMGRAIALEPLNAGWWMQYSEIERNLGKEEESEAAVRQALLTNPSPRYRTVLGALLLRKGDKAGALKEFQEALRMDPNDRDAAAGVALITQKK